MVITLDGQSGTGKSTLAKLVAKSLNFKFLNSGMIYRSISYYFVKNKITPSDEQKILSELKNISINILFKNNEQNIEINGINCTPHINDREVQETVSIFSQILPIRERVLSAQREYAKNNNIVVEGRDIGTEVFPNAEYKFFVCCDLDVRAKRRYDDLIKSGKSISLTEVTKSLKNRDFLDMNREFSPLRKPENAIEIDTSNKTIEHSLSDILSNIQI